MPWDQPKRRSLAAGPYEGNYRCFGYLHTYYPGARIAECDFATGPQPKAGTKAGIFADIGLQPYLSSTTVPVVAYVVGTIVD